MVTMSYLREVVRKNKNGTVVTYYEEVESHRVNGDITIGNVVEILRLF